MSQYWDSIKRSVEFIQEHFKRETLPPTAVVLGSGFKDFLKSVENPQSLAYEEIPGFKAPTVKGHGGEIVIGKIDKQEVCVFSGRIHLYEGHTPFEVVYPIRVVSTIGVQNLILTNAAGSLRKDLSPGQIVLIRDHVNLTGTNCLIGLPDELGPFFIDMSKCYHPKWRQNLLEMEPNLSEGVYAGVVGPSYETTAEVQMMAKVGCDLVGMSTVQEAIAAHHMKINVMAMSFVTNLAGGLGDEDLNHEDVLDLVNQNKQKMISTLTHAVMSAP